MPWCNEKGQQIKALTDRLLDSGSRDLETIEDGKLLMEQLAGEWEEILENTFPCIVDTKNCPAFYGSFDIQELRRIFDNLASNVEKYADREQPVELRIDAVDKRLRVCQRNGIKTGHGSGGEQSNRLGKYPADRRFVWRDGESFHRARNFFYPDHAF